MPRRIRPRSAQLTGWLCLATFTLASVHVQAAAPDTVDEAEAVAATAAKRFKERQFVVAGELFLRAYDLRPRPAVLFNAARSYEEAGETARAIELFEAYIEVAEDVGGRTDAQVRIDLLGRAAAHQGAVSSPATGVEPTRPHLQDLQAVAPSAVVAPAPARSSRAPGVATLAAGVAVAGTGLAFYLMGSAGGSSLQADLAKRDAAGHIVGVRQVDVADRNASIARDKTIAAVLGPVGVAAAAVGVYLLVRPNHPPESAAFWLAPSGQGIAFGGQF